MELKVENKLTKEEEEIINRLQESFKNSESYFKNAKKVVYTGNPCGENALAIKKTSKVTLGFKPTDKLIIIVAGSLGSETLNNKFKSFLCSIDNESYKVLYITGNNYYEEFENVGEIWRNLEKEIQELKVQVYEEQLEKQKTKIDYLQLQIRPHFYINCLNSIYSMAQLKHTEEIQQLALYVSGYMRSIFRKGTKPILMDEELQQIVNYVKIHNILYHQV